MIASDGRAKLVDIGFPIIHPSDQTVAMTTVLENNRRFLLYIPELLASRNFAHHSKETNVWSFGMAVYVSSFSWLR